MRAVCSSSRTLTGHTDRVIAVAVTRDGQRAASSHDQTLKVWELETDEVLATFTCDCRALCCAFSEALKLILARDIAGHSTSSTSKKRSPNTSAFSD